MGWSSGSQLAEELYETIRSSVHKVRRVRVANAIIEAFENHDADDWSEDSQLWVDSGRPTWEDDDGA